MAWFFLVPLTSATQTLTGATSAAMEDAFGK